MNSPIGYSDIDPGVFWKLATREIGTGFVESTVSVMGRSLSAQDMWDAENASQHIKYTRRWDGEYAS